MKPKSHFKPAGSRNQSKLPSAASVKSVARPKIMLVSRLLLNDQLWAQGDVVVVEAGRTIQLTPHIQPRDGSLLQSGDIPLTRY
jgi:hypothetical protein